MQVEAAVEASQDVLARVVRLEERLGVTKKKPGLAGSVGVGVWNTYMHIHG